MAEATVVSARGKNMFKHGDYLFHFQKNLVGDKQRYLCEFNRKTKCPASVHVMDGLVIKEVGSHTCSAVGNSGRCEARLTTTKMCAAATSTMASTQRILTQNISGISETAASQLPSAEVLRRTIRKRRNATTNAPPVPNNREDFHIPPGYQRTDDERKFLQVDTGPGEDRILIFATDEGLTLLENSAHWLCDGTFKSSPTIFFQLYTFHAMVQERVVPCVYALLPNKREETYRTFLDEMLGVNPNLNPTSVMMDFECAMRNAVTSMFEGVQVAHCHFHLCQNVFRQVQAKGLQALYSESAEVATHARMLMALAFLPPDDVEDGFTELAEDCSEELEPVVEYFENTYIGKKQRNGRRRSPLFKIPTWNVYDRSCHGLPRTNNPCEGSHSRLAANLTCQHPDLFKLIKALVREEALTRMNVTHALIGHPPPVKKKRYLDREKRISALIETYTPETKLPYLRGVSYNIAF